MGKQVRVLAHGCYPYSILSAASTVTPEFDAMSQAPHTSTRSRVIPNGANTIVPDPRSSNISSEQLTSTAFTSTSSSGLSLRALLGTKIRANGRFPSGTSIREKGSPMSAIFSLPRQVS